MRPLAKFFSHFILHRAGHLEQLDHSQNPFRILFFPPGKLPGTIRPLASLLSFYHRVGRLEQLDHFFQKKTNKKNQSNEKRKGFHAYFSLQNLLFKVKRK
jgi:hypothetical protein